ncbi:hypothetical protein LWI29_022162 [Acer saccharum]|uniref:Uncharacterized protein n=1 Tax=Acer saccharum TaxID=4024 RepID=A0AA39RXB9_ACESA|nr:hypothetical protein LWI29_022162 [Acer saccharum]
MSIKFVHFTANLAILEAFEGHDCVHVVDFNLMHGLQWPTLIQALALRPVGPPLLKLIAIGPPSPDGCDSLRKMGLRLAELARSVNIRFGFRGVVASRLEDVKPWMLQPEKALTEIYIQREIMNVVCCEGWVYVERHESLAKWRTRLKGAGFRPLHLGSNAFIQANMLLTLFSVKGYSVEENDGCLTLGWHSGPLIAASAWQTLPDLVINHHGLGAAPLGPPELARHGTLAWPIMAVLCPHFPKCVGPKGAGPGRHVFTALSVFTALQVSPKEALAVNSIMQLYKLLDSPMEIVLGWIQNLNPRIMTIVEQETNHNQPEFLDRFTTTLHYYLTMLQPEKALTEIYIQREIMNVVCCEGWVYVERHELLAKWRTRLKGAGFRPLHLGSNAFIQANMLLTLFSVEGYSVEENDGCLTLGWHSGPLIAASAWKTLPDLVINHHGINNNFL